MPLLTFDLDSGALLDNADFSKPRTQALEAKRGDTCQLQLQFVSDGEAVELPEGTLLKFGAKPSGAFDEDYILYTDSFSGPDDDLRYTASLSLNTVELNALLGVGSPTPDLASIALTAEVEREAAGNIRSSQAFELKVLNDVNKGDEGIPSQAGGNYYTKTQADARFLSAVPDNGSFRIKTTPDGSFFQLWNPTQSKWHTVWVTGAASQEQITLGPAENP